MRETLDQVRERLEQGLRGQAERIQKLEQSLHDLTRQHAELAREARAEIEALQARPPAGVAGVSLESLFDAVQKLAKAGSAETVFDLLVEEGHGAGARSAIFRVNHGAAECFLARGFKTQEQRLAALAIPVGSNDHFRQVCESGVVVETHAAALGSKDLLNVFEAVEDAEVLLLPIRERGLVSAVLYCDSGEGDALPKAVLKILAEFASAQLDRLSGSAAAPQPQVAQAAGMPAPTTPEVEAAAPTATKEEAEPQAVGQLAAAESQAEAPAPVEPIEPPPAAQPPQARPGPVNVDQLSETEQKVHRDAKRFSRLLVSEIELYNKTKVAEGRKNGDLYSRLKTDIERSRQTYQKRFGSTSASQFDYFHDELVRALAQGDPSLLGPDYPGPMA